MSSSFGATLRKPKLFAYETLRKSDLKYLRKWLVIIWKFQEDELTSQPLPQFILLGDSLTQGANDQSQGFALASELQHGLTPTHSLFVYEFEFELMGHPNSAYVRRLDIINRGFSGYTTTHALEVLQDILPTPEQTKIEFLTIWYGANDANLLPSSEPQVPLPAFKSNLHSLLTHPSITSHKPKIILLTPGPFEENILIEFRDRYGYDHEVRRAADAKLYAEAVLDVGKEAGVEVLDVWGLFMKLAGWGGGEVLSGSVKGGKSDVLEGLLVDGLHLSPKGYKVVFDALIKVIKKRWPEYPPYKMPFAVKVGWEKEMGGELWDVNNDA